MRVLGLGITALVLAFGLLTASAPVARADPYTDALSHFTADSFDETIEGINGVAASGNPRFAGSLYNFSTSWATSL